MTDNTIKVIKTKVNEINKKNKFDNEKVKEINKKIEQINDQEEINIPLVRNINLDRNNLFDEIGILDPEGKNPNPLTKDRYNNLYQDSNNMSYSDYGTIWSNLPVYEQRNEILETLYDNQCLLLSAGTGSGKTVILPKLLLHILNYQGKIAITTPRRAMTIGNARFAAQTLDVPLGQEVGYKIKGDKKAGAETNLLYTTDGSVVKMFENDPALSNLDALIIDEAHERGINIDLLMMYVKETLKQRPKFKLIIMSATIEPKIFMNYYKEFGIKYIEGYAKTPKKIEEEFLKKSIYKLDKNGEIMGNDYRNNVVEILTEKILFPKKEGDILVILPSKSDCQECCVILDRVLAEKKKKDPDFQEKPFCIQLTADFGGNNKDKGTLRYALNSSYKEVNNSYTRRIIMATEVAESGITFEGDDLIWVIDSGLSMQNIYYPEENMEALEKRFISKASHTQRKGRVGRKVDGYCYNLFTEDEYKKFQDYTTPPILVEDLANNILSLFKSVSHVNLPFSYKKKDKDSLNLFLHNMISPPTPKYVSSAISRYFLIKAINVEKNKGYLSPLGRELTRFGGKKNISPFNAACAIEGFNLRTGREVADVIALLEVLENKIERLFNKPKDKNKMKDYDKKVSSFVSSYGEHVTLFHIMKKYRQKKYNLTYERGIPKYTSKETEEASKWAKDNYINAKKLKDAVDVAKDINRNIGLIIRRTPRTGDKVYLFRETEPKRYDKVEDNIMSAIVTGLISNIVKKFKKSYKTCFPEVKTIGDIDRFSLFNYVKVKPSVGIYSHYIKIGGRKRFTIFSKVPTKIINDFKDREKDILKMC